MDFNLELEQLSQSKKKCLVEVRNVDKKRQEEIEQVTRQINDKYSELSKNMYKELGEHNDRIDAYCKMLESYSYFDERSIGNTIASLMRVFEGVNFIYQDTDYLTKKVQRLVFDIKETKVTKHPRIIVAEEYKAEFYSDDRNSLNSLVKNGKALILVDDAGFLEKGIIFYYANTDSHSLEQTVKFGKFSYVKEFIDSLISYKIERKLKSISSDELAKLERDFIASRLEQIEENYRIIEQNQEEQMRQKLAIERENRQLRLRRILDKK